MMKNFKIVGVFIAILLFVKLLLAHLIGDFILQPNSWVSDKEAKTYKSKFLYAHVLLHGILVLILVGEKGFIPFAIALAVSHGIIDFLKLHYQKLETERSWFLLDQFLHIIVLIIIGLVYSDFNFKWYSFCENYWLMITAIVLLTKPISLLIKKTISIWTPENKSEKEK